MSKLREQLKVTVTVDREWFRWTREDEVQQRLAALTYASLTRAHHNLCDNGGGVHTIKVEGGAGEAHSIEAHFDEEPEAMR